MKSAEHGSDDESEGTVPAPRPYAPASALVSAADLALPPPTKTGAIPAYAIDDQSRIEITQTTHQFQLSMAANHFSSSSIEASVYVFFVAFFPSSTLFIPPKSRP